MVFHLHSREVLICYPTKSLPCIILDVSKIATLFCWGFFSTKFTAFLFFLKCNIIKCGTKGRPLLAYRTAFLESSESFVSFFCYEKVHICRSKEKKVEDIWIWHFSSRKNIFVFWQLPSRRVLKSELNQF